MSINTAMTSMKTAVKEAENKLASAESECAEIRKQIDEYEAAREHNHLVATHRSALEGEREDLKGRYAEALYEAVDDDIAAIQDRRKAIDAELSELATVPVPELDTYAIADLSYRIVKLKFPYFGTLQPWVNLGIMQPMYEELEASSRTHDQRKRTAVEGFSRYITSDDSHAVKMANDGQYAREHRAHEAAEKKRVADNIHTYGTANPSFSSTDALETAMERAKRSRK